MDKENMRHYTIEGALKLKPETEGLHRQLDIHDVWVDEEGRAIVEMEGTLQSLNPFGAVHGGSFFTLCDIAAEAVIVLNGRMAVTLDSTIHFYRPGVLGRTFTAVAEERKKGRGTSVVRVAVHDNVGEHIIDAIFTMYHIK